MTKGERVANERRHLDATLVRLCASNLDGNDPLLECAIETLRVDYERHGWSFPRLRLEAQVRTGLPSGT